MALKMSDLPTHKEMVKNILYTYYSATEDERESGMNWYQKAYEECVRIAESTNGWVEVEQVIGVVAVTSAGVDWGENISIPERMIDLHMRGIPVEKWEGFTCYKANLRKAAKVLDGDYTVVRGKKTVAFFCNINKDAKPVTIDRWAVRIALDFAHLPSDMLAPSTPKVYNAIADAYVMAAEMIGIENRQLQAVTWEKFRNQYMGKIGRQRNKVPKAQVDRIVEMAEGVVNA